MLVRLLPVLAALALLAPAAALGALPSPSSQRIVLGRSIGGAALGDSFASAKRAWHSHASCTKQKRIRACVYDGGLRSGVATIQAFDRKVSELDLTAGFTATGSRVLHGPLSKFKTSRGIGIGSSRRALVRAYPKLRRATSHLYTRHGPGKVITSIELARGRVVAITIADGRHQGP
jgi:hypothetical protein